MIPPPRKVIRVCELRSLGLSMILHLSNTEIKKFCQEKQN